MSQKDEANAYYNEHYKGRGLAPKHVVALKAALAKALRKGEKPAAAAKALFKEKGITLGDPGTPISKKANNKEKTNSKKRKKNDESNDESGEEASDDDDETEKSAAPVVDNVSKVVPLPPSEVSAMNRKDLKATIAQLSDAGVEIKYSKKDDDDVLRRKINDAMVAMPSPKMIKTLESIDPDKLKTVLKQDCLGLFVDIRSPSCQACPDFKSCVDQFIVNLKGDFSVFKPAMQELKTEEEAAKVTNGDAKAAKKSSKEAAASAKPVKADKIKWDPDRFVAVVDVNLKTLDKSHDTYSTIKAIMKEVPTTFGELREIVEREWEFKDGDAGFVNDWIVTLRDIGYIKLEGDLDKDERAAYVGAGLLK